MFIASDLRDALSELHGEVLGQPSDMIAMPLVEEIAADHGVAPGALLAKYTLVYGCKPWDYTASRW